jgi:hypothetical protein
MKLRVWISLEKIDFDHVFNKAAADNITMSEYCSRRLTEMIKTERAKNANKTKTKNVDK